MSQNYAKAHLKVLDEKFFTESKTDMIINKGIRLEFTGVKTVTIYTVDVVDEVDYIRNGTERFGSLIELGTGTQEFTMSQDKSFTFSVDRGNLEDSMLIQEANTAVKRQVRQVSVPNTDKYRLAVLVAYAVANNQKQATAALNSTNAYTTFLADQAALDDAEVAPEDRVTYLTPTTYNLFKLDQNFIKGCDHAYDDLKKGIIGTVDGNTLVKIPTSWFPANIDYLTVHRQVLVAPTKFNMVRVLTEVRGVDGAVAEGRRYYDAFIPKNKGVAIRVHKNA
ncbi:hypothetical protein [Naasia lichenicola]|uniref:N4-gp56 family major capsid protein n=1 Tax=Naasia lichenicola TaxID=2565933 RepID=A0A4S4FR57_9MICO|nr:hypothetical protein [Naasia lichenicola]THG30679.1 hypothetical protein E6C64_08545 [Naasia lichenicola]THG31916.1 hypothetical protein E6C64_07690 [Naasia lichenicola]